MIVDSFQAGLTLLWLFLPVLGIWFVVNWIRVKLGGRPGIGGLLRDFLQDSGFYDEKTGDEPE